MQKYYMINRAFLAIITETWMLSNPYFIRSGKTAALVIDEKRFDREVVLTTEYLQFIAGEKVLNDLTGIKVHLDVPGPALDYTLSISGVCIVSSRFKQELESCFGDGVQFFPVIIEETTIEPKSIHDEFFIMNVCKKLDCLDHNRSQVSSFPENMPPPAQHLSGKIAAICHFVLDPTRMTGSEDVFVLSGAPHILFISEKVRKIILQNGYTGMKLIENDIFL